MHIPGDFGWRQMGSKPQTLLLEGKSYTLLIVNNNNYNIKNTINVCINKVTII